MRKKSGSHSAIRPVTHGPAGGKHAAGAKQMFAKMDADGDGIVTAKEMDAAHKDMPTAQKGSTSESDTASASRLGKSENMHHDKSAAAKIKIAAGRDARAACGPARSVGRLGLASLHSSQTGARLTQALFLRSCVLSRILDLAPR